MRKQLTKVISAITAGLCLFGAATCTTIPDSVIIANAADYMDRGEADGYVYEVWNMNGDGKFEFEQSGQNGFTANWNGISNFAVTKGKSFKNDTVSAYRFKDLKITYDLDFVTDGSDYTGIRGWLTRPNTLFNIVEAWGSWRPCQDQSPISSVTVNGTAYDIYKTHSGQFDADQQYNIYWSVARRDPIGLKTDSHIEGTIDVAEHFRAWSAAGLELGNIYDVQFDVEAYKSSGSAKLNSLDIIYDISDENVFGPQTLVMPYEEHDPLPVDVDGKIIKVDFESGNDKAGAMGTESAAEITGERFYSGKQSVHISGSDEPGCPTFFYELDPYDLPESHDISGNYYQTGARIFNNSDKDVSFEIELIEYSEAPFTYNKVTEIGSRICKAGQWTNVNDLLFDFEHNVYHKYRVIFSPSNPLDYYVDDFYIASGDPGYCVGMQKFEPDVRGDLNGDGVVNSLDLIACRKAIMSSLGVGRIEMAGDVNGDFRSNVSDLVLLTKYVLNASKDIPISDEGAVLLIGDWVGAARDSHRGLCITDNKYNDDRLRTILRNDDTLTAEWKDTSYYFCESYDDYSNSSNRRPSRDFDVSYSADIKASGYADVMLRGTVQKGNKSFRFMIYEGWTEHGKYSDYDKMLSEGKGITTVTLGGEEYYMTKFITTDLISGIKETEVEFYRKDNQLKSDESCHLENSFDLEEVVKYWDNDDEIQDQVIRLGIVIDTDSSSGYADFRELKFYEQ